MSDGDTRGILTSTDKAWLRGEKEYEHRQTENDRREKIRERVSSAMQDFTFLIEHWSSKERQKAMEGIDLNECGSDVIEFLYLALNEPAQEAEQMVNKDSLDRALAFRRALCHGIQEGKKHFGDVPQTVLIDANTTLFEVPSEEDLKRAIDTGQWRDANDYLRGAYSSSDDLVIDKEEAAKSFHMELHLAVERELYSRRQNSDAEIKRHDILVGSTGLLDQRGDDQ